MESKAPENTEKKRLLSSIIRLLDQANDEQLSCVYHFLVHLL